MNEIIKNTSRNAAFSPELLHLVPNWLERLNINYKNTRFGKSISLYKKWLNGECEPNFDELWGISELMDLFELYNSFHETKELETLFIKEITKGTDFLFDEKKSRARDLFFEAKVASRFKRAGYKIIPDKSHDLVVSKGECIFQIECKRPRNRKSLIDNLEYAYKRQLNKLPDRKAQGMIFIDLSRILYDKFPPALSQRECKLPIATEESITEYRDDLDESNKRYIQKKAPEIAFGVKMIATNYRFPFLIESQEYEGHYKFSRFDHFTMMSSLPDRENENILSAFRGSVGKQL